jgi:carbonic anhydrase
VKAALTRKSYGLVVDKWLRKVKDVHQQHLPSLTAIPDPALRLRRMVELNVVQQVTDLAHTSVIQQSWKDRGGPLLHGWVYDMENGKLSELTRLEPRDLQDDIYRFDLE